MNAEEESTGSAGGDPAPVEAMLAGADRDRTADDRDERADAHDEASETRDRRADARDDRAEARELDADHVDIGAAADRAGALRDRRGGASDRIQAADDRDAASADRALSAQERAVSSIDQLTGAHRRDAGTVELEREMARAKRAEQPFVLAFVDVVGLKQVNDSLGHAAGDEILRATAHTMRTHLRSYDLIIRFGGDEFVCALPNLSLADAAERFTLVNGEMAAIHRVSVTAGLAELEADDTVEDLVARADAAMYDERQQLHTGT